MKLFSLNEARNAIVAGGCLAMAYVQLITSPATVRIARAWGGTGFHVGLLGAMPVMFFFMQLVAAVATREFTYRKPLWLAVSILQRLVFVPIAVLPWIFPQVSNGAWLWLLVGSAALNHAMLQFGTPLWLGWMGDYLPHEGLSSFWGRRHSAQQWVAAVAILFNAFCFTGAVSEFALCVGFTTIFLLGSLCGLIDVLLFIWVVEPPATHAPLPRLRDVLLGPWRDPAYRSFIEFTCFWHLAAMVGAPFISLYLLEHIGLSLFAVLMLWAISWVGGAALAKPLGRWVDRFGNRPVQVLCVAFKSANMIALLFAPRDPTLAFWMLAPVFAFDAFLNAGISIANNGFLLKNSPKASRTMFVAAGNGYAGMVGGITSIVAGAILAATEGWSTLLAGQTWVNFHAMFAISIALRFVAIPLAFRVREPRSTKTSHVLRFAVRRVTRRLRAA